MTAGELPGPLPGKVDALFPGALRERLTALRRELHANPELSNEEHETAQRLTAALIACGVDDVHPVGATGVLARVPGRNRAAPAVAIRGDIDALPIHEATGLPFASRQPGIMHACGHDVHATWAVGAAALLARQPADGDVVILLQPAEEVGDGALQMIRGGALDGVAAIFGGHVDRRFALGQVVAEAGPLAASADTFEIELVGRGAHAARPHEGADPVVGAGALVLALQTIVSRRIDPATAAVVTIGTLHAGVAPNVIPDTAKMSGTIRAVDAATRALAIAEVKRIAGSTATAYALEALVTVTEGTPPVVNPARPVSWARAAAASLLGDDALVPLGITNMAAEDFAHYLEKIPGCFLRIGAREGGGPVIPAHSPRFYAAEESIFIGAAVLAESARVASRALGSAPPAA
ncbi:MAG TPA: M20 family metallopeptidase [Gemmatimonadaceae bacterium]|nr:M20 family metallopeptidase [Gemmatimonadaceae bacterium]